MKLTAAQKVKVARRAIAQVSIFESLRRTKPLPPARATQPSQMQLLVDDRPAPTDVTAPKFVKLIMAGVPVSDAVTFFHADYRRDLNEAVSRKWITPKQWHQLEAAWHRRWMADERVIHELDRRRGGAWEDLTDKMRVQRAKEHHVQQLAYFLYTTDYNDPFAPLAKIADARKALSEMARAGDDGAQIFEKFMRDLQAGDTTVTVAQMKRTHAPVGKPAIEAGVGVTSKLLSDGGAKVYQGDVVDVK